jgi:hypothetical protein
MEIARKVNADRSLRVTEAYMSSEERLKDRVEEDLQTPKYLEHRSEIEREPATRREPAKAVEPTNAIARADLQAYLLTAQKEFTNAEIRGGADSAY